MNVYFYLERGSWDAKYCYAGRARR